MKRLLLLSVVMVLCMSRTATSGMVTNNQNMQLNPFGDYIQITSNGTWQYLDFLASGDTTIYDYDFADDLWDLVYNNVSTTDFTLKITLPGGATGTTMASLFDMVPEPDYFIEYLTKFSVYLVD